MIGMLNGKVIFIGERHIILDVGGVGYTIYVTADSLSRVAQASPESEEKMQFWTHLYVRENSLDLFGFLTKAEVDFFNILIGVSGVGPKSALGILGVAPLDTLKQAIASGDASYLSKVSGIGRKTAEKISLELRDKLGAGLDRGAVSGMIKDEQDVIEALEALGYSFKESRDALLQVPKDVSGTENRIKESLKLLGK